MDRHGLLPLALLACCLGAGGCKAPWNPLVWHAWLDPSKTVSVTDDEADLISIFDQVDPMEDHREIFPNAETPVLEDLAWADTDYTLGPGDVLHVSVLDLYAEGQEAVLQRVVSNAGYIDLPYLERMQVRGLTTHQVAVAVRGGYQPDYLKEPVVSVATAAKQENYYSVTGAVARPSRYAIPRREFRLMEALAIAGDVVQNNLEYVYVIRRTEASDALRQPTGPTMTPTVPMTPEQLPPLPGIEPTPAIPVQPTPPEPGAPGDDLIKELQQYMPGAPTGPADPQPAVPTPAVPPTQPTAPAPAVQPSAVEAADAEMRRLREAMAPGAPIPSTRPVKPTVLHFSETEALVGAAEITPTADMVWAFQNGQWIQVPANGSGVDQGDASGLVGGPQISPVDPDDPFGWAQADMSNLARIIAISLPRLKEGDPRQNIVVRDGDMVYVPPLRVGEFFVTGEVLRPGPVSLTGRKVTVKMAMAFAGGFNQLAWPSNSVLVRRIGTNQELRIPLRLDRIMAGKEPEILLKPDDIIMVGTHIASPFLAVIRNSFRMTYGFGFIYDRNFAERNFGQYQGIEEAMGDLFDP